MKLRHVYGIDMGTGSVKIYDRNNNSIIKEYNMIALRGKDNVFAVGNDAYDIFEKTPENMELITPMSGGRIQNVLMMEAVLHLLLRKTGRFAGYSPLLYFSVPLDMTELERRAYVSIAQKGRFKRSRVLFVEKPFADAFALGLPVEDVEGTMLVNLGAQNTEISILCKGQIIINRTIDIGGDRLNAAVVSGVRKKNSLTISQRCAHRLKITLADLAKDPVEGCKVAGIDTESGLPRDGIISSYTVSSCVREVVSEIALEIRRLLERIPPQIQAVLQKEGIWISGGCTRIPGMDRCLEGMLDYPVHLSEHFEFTTIQGLKEIIDHTELREYAFAPQRRKYGML